MWIALTREISAITRCELTHLDREPIDLALAHAQHADYEKHLEAAGCRVTRIPAADDMPDSVFIEDTAVVLPEVAIIARPGAASRREETPGVEDALRLYRHLAQIEAPGRLDGGDVLVAGRRVFVGASGRTNLEGSRQMRNILAPYGYEVEAIEVRGCLHLKSAVTLIGEKLLLMNRAWLPRNAFPAFDHIEVDPQEPMAANALLAGGRVICAASFPRTRDRIEARGIQVQSVDVSEIAKAEGALTCCSLIFDSSSKPVG
jgi:dimethylargininase